MNRYLISVLFILVVLLASGSYFFVNFWEHRYDEVISRQARIFNIDAALVWSIVYEETYFRTTSLGADGEIGLMQVTAPVARDWAKETGLATFERQVNDDLTLVLPKGPLNLSRHACGDGDVAGRVQRRSEPRRRMDSGHGYIEP